MIRDITIGQYYPAESRIHRLDPRVKIVCTLLFPCVAFHTEQSVGIRDRYYLPGNRDPAVKGALKIYRKRIKAGRDPAAVHCNNEPAPHPDR